LQTNNRLEYVNIREKVVEVKAGSNHVLARTIDGKVYGWGDNTFGQVGVRANKLKSSHKKSSTKRYNNIFSPTLVYSPEKKKKDAIQIVAYNDSSFLLSCDDQTANDIYGWGKNENGLLCTSKDKCSTPTRIKTKATDIIRIDVQHGHFMGYLADVDEGEMDIEEDFSQDEYFEEKADLVMDIETIVVPGGAGGKMGRRVSVSGEGKPRDKSISDTVSVGGMSRSSRRSSRTRANKSSYALKDHSDMITKVQEGLK